ncbi:DNA repair protein RecN, partial [Deinococcus aquaticus]
QLGMPHARLEFQLTPLPEPGAHGLSDVTLQFTANPGEDLAPLADVASGGELSRVMLAISTVLGADTPAVVFDEVDAGIGGGAALAVAAQLRHLAQTRQVFVVTHLAQIAAQADHHFKVEKSVEAGRTVSRVRLLPPEERLHEIARMLSGNTSDAALQHARELLG